jgi:hypothetical protein
VLTPRRAAERQARTLTPAPSRTARRGVSTAVKTAPTRPGRTPAHAAAPKPRPATVRPPATRAAAPPSLVSPVDSSALHAGRSDSRLAIGLGMLAFSVVALLGGFAVAEVRRRRVPVRRPNA